MGYDVDCGNIMAGRPIKLGVGIAAAVGAAVFLGWQLLGFVEEVWGPEANPFAPRPVIAPPRLAVRLAEVVPPRGTATLRDVSYAAVPGDVPGWRMRAGGETAADAGVKDSGEVAQWRGSDKPLWRQPLGGQGNSTPIVVGEWIFCTIADGGPTLWLVCFNLENGFGVWRQPVSREPFPPRHEKASDAASTPCSDGTRVFVAHAAADTVHLTAFSLDGQSLWTTKLGPFTARWGFTCSPAWSRGLVIVGADNAHEGFLAAVDGETGKGVWRRRRPRAGDESYSSPVVVAGGAGEHGEPQVVMAGLERIEAHSLATGRTLWGTGGLASTSGATPAIAEDICVATSGYPTRAMVAVRMDPDGAVPTVLWKEDRDSEIPYVPSPLVHDGRLYVVHDDGVAHCRDLATGKVAWKRRVGGTFSASPVIVNGELLCADESGRCTLLDLDEGTVQHEFALTGGCFATPVVVRDRLLVRTTQELVAFDVAGH
jgi:outer membrane protein assembly factor BamB